MTFRHPFVSKNSVAVRGTPKDSHLVQVWKGRRSHIAAGVSAAHRNDLELLGALHRPICRPPPGHPVPHHMMGQLSKPCPHLSVSSHKPLHRAWWVSCVTLEGVHYFVTAPNMLCPGEAWSYSHLEPSFKLFLQKGELRGCIGAAFRGFWFGPQII